MNHLTDDELRQLGYPPDTSRRSPTSSDEGRPRRPHVRRSLRRDRHRTRALPPANILEGNNDMSTHPTYSTPLNPRPAASRSPRPSRGSRRRRPTCPRPQAASRHRSPEAPRGRAVLAPGRGRGSSRPERQHSPPTAAPPSPPKSSGPRKWRVPLTSTPAASGNDYATRARPPRPRRARRGRTAHRCGSGRVPRRPSPPQVGNRDARPCTRPCGYGSGSPLASSGHPDTQGKVTPRLGTYRPNRPAPDTLPRAGRLHDLTMTEVVACAHRRRRRARHAPGQGGTQRRQRQHEKQAAKAWQKRSSQA